MEGVLLVGGMLADKACVPTPRPTLRSKSWHLSVGPGPPGWGFMSVWYPLLPVSPAARVHFNSLSVLRSLSHKICALTSRRTLRSSLGIASKKPMRCSEWVSCPSHVPRMPYGPADGALCTLEQNACPSPVLCPGHPAQRWTHSSWPVLSVE